MPAQRIFDCFAQQFGDSPAGANNVQVVGAGALGANYGYRPIHSEHDGTIGPASVDRGAFYCGGALACGDVSTFMAVLASFEAAAGFTRAILAEGREVGAATVTDILIKRAVLTAARISCVNNRYAGVSYDYACSCAAASDSPDDEISFTSGQVKTAAIGSGKRTFQVVSAIEGGGSAQAFAAGAFDLSVAAQRIARDAGDDDWGETVDVADFRFSGTVGFKDYTVAASKSKAQAMIDAAVGALVVVLKQQGAAANTTLTLANAKFFELRETYQVGDYWVSNAAYQCETVSGATVYQMATGANKMITMA